MKGFIFGITAFFSSLMTSIRHRITEGLRVAVMAAHVFSVPICVSYFLLSAAFPLFWPFVFFYILHIIYDRSYEDGRSLTNNALSFRSSVFWKLFASYFPITLHKSVDLLPCFVPEAWPPAEPLQGPSFIWKLAFWWWYFLIVPVFFTPSTSTNWVPTGRRYIFGYHPHGIISMGMVGAIASEGAGWSKIFPGIPVRALTLINQFLVPFYREYLLLLGMASVARNSCEKLLQNNQPICIVIGGARESLLARPGKMDLVLGSRLGFIKLGIQCGQTDVVPIMAFGENDLYDQAANDESSLLYKIQTWLKNALGFTLPLMNARGIFNYEVGLLPYRRPVHVVVGKPIQLPHIPEPTQEDLEKYHGLYLGELERIFEENKALFYIDWKGNTPLKDYSLGILD